MTRARALKLWTFVRLPVGEQLLAIVALLLIAVASAMIALLPFRRFAGLLGQPRGAVGYTPVVDAQALRRAVLIRRAVGRAATVAPFRSDCLPQAIAAAVLARLLRVSLSIHLGVALEGGGMSAHAWSTAGPVAVSGGYSFGSYTIVSCFVVESR